MKTRKIIGILLLVISFFIGCEYESYSEKSTGNDSSSNSGSSSNSSGSSSSNSGSSSNSSGSSSSNSGSSSNSSGSSSSNSGSGNTTETSQIYEATATTVKSVISNLPFGNHTVKVTGEIDENTITYIKIAINSSNAKVNLDLSKTTGLTYIEEEKFSSCAKLVSIIIPDSVISIGRYAFRNCFNLASVTIGIGVTSIGRYAFDGCSSLASAIFKDTANWYLSSFDSKINVANKAQAASYLTDVGAERQYDWYKQPILQCTKYSISDTTKISSSNNNNDVINPGETIKMDIEIYNRGNSIIEGLIIEISSDSQYITVTNGIADFGDLWSNNYKTYSGLKGSPVVNNFCPSYYPFTFIVSESCPTNTVIPITLTMTDCYGSVWKNTLNLDIY